MKNSTLAGEGVSGVVDHALVHRARDHRRVAAVQAAVYGPVQGLEHVPGVIGIESAAIGGSSQRDRIDPEGAARRRDRRRLVADLAQFEWETEARGPFLQQGRVGDHDQGRRPGLLCDLYAQIGADTGGLAGGDRDRARRHLQFRLSSSRSSM